MIAVAAAASPSREQRQTDMSKPDAVPSAQTVDAHGAFKGVWYACGQANTLPGHRYVYGGAKGTYSAWHRPMAVYAKPVGRTFFVFGTPANCPAISYYDHKTRTFADPVVLGRNIDGNAHRNPTLLIDEDGTLFVFRGYHGMPTHVTRSVRPYDVSRWKPMTPVEADTRSSYPQPWQLRAGEILVSYRREPGWSYRISTDGASSWGSRVNLVAFEGSAIYAVTVAETSGFPRALHIAWSRLGGGTPEEIRTKHLWARRYNVYYARSNDGGRTWRRSDGLPYTLPITEATAEKLYDCGQHGVWLKDMQLDAEGNPYILFIDADVPTYRSTWKVARHVSGKWHLADVTTSDHMYDGGALVVAGRDDLRIYAPTTPSQPRYDGGEIEEWRSVNGGRTWRNTAHVTTGSTYSHNHVKTVLHHERGAGDLRVLWSYGDATFPPATRDVYLYGYGEGMTGPRRIARGRPAGAGKPNVGKHHHH